MQNTQFAIIVSKFNETITSKLLDGAHKRLLEHGVNENQIHLVHVPGAIEIPLTAKLLARSKKYKAIICLGAVIQGETSHYDYVCDQVSQGCQQVMMEFDLPVIFGVLTVTNIKQAYDRIGGKEGHKGMEAADAAVEMVKVVSELV